MADIPDGSRRSAFVLAAVAGHAMIVNRLDYSEEKPGMPGSGAGVGNSLLELGSHETGEIGLLAEIAAFKRDTEGEAVVIIDGGANIGTHTVAWARYMTGWGSVMAFEPQERTFYALCGNIALNNCFNASASMTALASQVGRVGVPWFDPQQPANFGGVSLKREFQKERVYSHRRVPTITLDALCLDRLDILKLDIEGMEPDVLAGGRDTIARLKPIVFAETALCGNVAIRQHLPDHHFIECGMSTLAIHKDDETFKRIKVVGPGAISFNEGDRA